MDPSFLPTVNAGLNSIAAVLLLLGRRAIRRGAVDLHRRLMLSAFGVSSLFLVFYVLHKASKGFVNTPYGGEGAARTFYLAVLFSHLTLAMLVPVLAIALIRFGLRQEIGRHRRLARWAWPIWMYVSVTGVVIYLMLYPFNPAGV